MRKVLLLLLPLVALASLYLTWEETARAQLALRDSTDAGLARGAADYLTTITPPGAVGEFDAPRLLSAVHALSVTSFWPGGLQVLIGGTALLPDSIGLVPLPEPVLRVMDQSPTMVTVPAGQRRVQFVPLLARSGKHSGGWVGVWSGSQEIEPGVLLRIGYIGAAGGVVMLALLSLMRSAATWRWLTMAAILVMVVVIRAALGTQWESQLREATEFRVTILRHLVEVAATAPGVRQVTVQQVAASATVIPYALMPPAQSGVLWIQDSLGPAATILAATPRTLSGLKLVLHLPEPPEMLTGRVMPWLLVVLVVALVELLLSGLSRRPAIFQGNAAPPSSHTPAGTA
jgi:hypothetical protein